MARLRPTYFLFFCFFILEILKQCQTDSRIEMQSIFRGRRRTTKHKRVQIQIEKLKAEEISNFESAKIILLKNQSTTLQVDIFFYYRYFMSLFNSTICTCGIRAYL